MFITRTKKRIGKFYLDKNEDIKDLEAYLNDPSLIILDKTYGTETETSYEGESSVTIQRQFVTLEFEECSL